MEGWMCMRSRDFPSAENIWLHPEEGKDSVDCVGTLGLWLVGTVGPSGKTGDRPVLRCVWAVCSELVSSTGWGGITSLSQQLRQAEARPR